MPGATEAEIKARVRSILAAVGVNAAQVSITPNDLTAPASQVSVLVRVNQGANSRSSSRLLAGVALVGGAMVDREPAASD